MGRVLGPATPVILHLTDLAPARPPVVGFFAGSLIHLIAFLTGHRLGNRHRQLVAERSRIRRPISGCAISRPRRKIVAFCVAISQEALDVLLLELNRVRRAGPNDFLDVDDLWCFCLARPLLFWC
jgi:hypothetical protein